MTTDAWHPLRLEQERALLAFEFAARRALPVSPFRCLIPLRFKGRADRDAFARAVNHVIARHPALTARLMPNPWLSATERLRRLRVFAERGVVEPGTYLHVTCDPEPLDVRYVRCASERATVDAMRLFADAPFDLSAPPKIRSRIFASANGVEIGLTVVSHVVADAWSTALLRREIADAYSAAAAGRDCEFEPVRERFTAFAQWEQARLREGWFASSIAFWLAEWNRYRHHAWRPSDANAGSRKPVYWTAQLAMDPETSREIRRVCRRDAVTPYVYFRAAATVALCQVTGHRELSTYCNFRNRTPITSGTVGWFNNRHLVGMRLDPHDTYRDVLNRARAVTLATAAHISVPIQAVWNARGSCDEGGPEAVRPTFDYHVRQAGAEDTERVEPVAPQDLGIGTRAVAMELRIIDDGQQFVFVVSAARHILSPDYGRQLLETTLNAATLLLTAPTSTVGERSAVRATGLVQSSATVACR
jgi:hypothetical protein